jgi:hypothetical protein
MAVNGHLSSGLNELTASSLPFRLRIKLLNVEATVGTVFRSEWFQCDEPNGEIRFQVAITCSSGGFTE